MQDLNFPLFLRHQIELSEYFGAVISIVIVCVVIVCVILGVYAIAKLPLWLWRRAKGYIDTQLLPKPQLQRRINRVERARTPEEEELYQDALGAVQTLNDFIDFVEKRDRRKRR